MNIVYRFGCLRPIEGELELRRQMRLALEYHRDLTRIERGRRWAMREILTASASVQAAEERLRSASKTERRDARIALAAARRDALAAAADRIAEIDKLEQGIARDARALSIQAGLLFGTYLTTEAAARAARAIVPVPTKPNRPGLYDYDDWLTPSDPKWPWSHADRQFDAERVPERGQAGVQIQGGIPTARVLAGGNSYVRVTDLTPLHRRRGHMMRRGLLWIRVGGDRVSGPVWAKVPIEFHRQVPDAAIWKWVRVSLNRKGLQEKWSVEITVNTKCAHPHTLDKSLDGAIAVALDWVPLEDGSIRTARWLDSNGECGEIVVPARIVGRLRRASDIRSIRDKLRGQLTAAGSDEVRGALVKALAQYKDGLPAALAQRVATMPLWKSATRFMDLADFWRRQCPEAAPAAYEILRAWEKREVHLYSYECGARSGAIGARSDLYHCVASAWARQYRVVLLPDRNLSREARFGPESDVRFAASTHQLKSYLQQSFGPGALKEPWAGKTGTVDAEGAPADWLGKTIERYRADPAAYHAREVENRTKFEVVAGGAWAKRKAAAAAKRLTAATAREEEAKLA